MSPRHGRTRLLERGDAGTIRASWQKPAPSVGEQHGPDPVEYRGPRGIDEWVQAMRDAIAAGEDDSAELFVGQVMYRAARPGR